LGSIAEPLPGNYDLVTRIEVLEHMPEELANQAIRSMTAATSKILFSSSPADFNEPTHITVRPSIYWLRRFAHSSFAPVISFDASFVFDAPIDDHLLLGAAEIIRLRLENFKQRTAVQDMKNAAANLCREVNELREFKRGVYRNSFFILVRLMNRIANALRSL
jgi:hypothetical protein